MDDETGTVRKLKSKMLFHRKDGIYSHFFSKIILQLKAPMYTNKQICLLNVNQAISCYRDPNPFFFAQGIMKYILFQYP